jgi:CDK-activating kinase assembly factor MAT1
MNLVSGTGVRETENQLQEYAAENMGSIRANQALEKEEATTFQEQQTLEQEQAQLRRQAAKQEYEDERREVFAGQQDTLRKLAAGKPSEASAIAREGQKVLLKKSSARRSEEDRIRQKQAALRSSDAKRAGQAVSAADTTGDTGLVKGLKKVKTPEPEKPYDPFDGMVPDKRDYYTLRDFYPSTYLDRIRKDTRMQAGGFDLREYYSRTLLEAFAGLGCFIDEEVSKRDPTSMLGVSKPATEGAAMAAVSGSRTNEETA